jgi:glyoxylase-like metal-dependent hydrolase (beta-lactamase superfamily II)
MFRFTIIKLRISNQLTSYPLEGLTIEVKILEDLKVNGCEVFPIFVPVQAGLKSINFYLIKNENSLTLIDAGINTEQCWEFLLTSLKQNNLHLQDITEIILTHHHWDHIGLVNRIVSNHPIPVYVSPLSIPRLQRDSEFLNMRVEFFSKLYQEMGCGEAGKAKVAFLRKAIDTNKDQAILTNLTEIVNDRLLQFDIIELPGHAPDQLAFYDKNRNWLFGGDFLISHISSNALVEPGSDGKRIPSLIQHIHSLKKCEHLDVELVYSGHGALIQNSSQLIKKRLNKIEDKSARILGLIESGISTGSEIAQTAYKKLYYDQFSLVMSEIIGHLDYLESMGKINKEFVKGIWHYKANQMN